MGLFSGWDLTHPTTKLFFSQVKSTNNQHGEFQH